MPKIRGTCIFPGCTNLQRKRPDKGYRSVCRKHCGKSPNQKADQEDRRSKAKKSKYLEASHEIRRMTGFKCNSFHSFMRCS